ncbi:hypothetical protein [Chryseobacterium indoltheticum]|uniref:Uncharacterized protein n=1 Tax=Chryseobacterium indoltheticum TaxID=254 RepID=A0A3G6MYZ2_9FLAO|nr:hypothetical protein [Chryseobacterium indoltheticum]AZA61031.1 hypothetical protein EG340_08210 [Chryseobacterium indoltheticum]
MKIILKLKWIFLILIFINCKEQNTKNEPPAKTTFPKEISKIEDKDELYVGKEFFSGDELNTYTFLKSGKIHENDSLTYSIYKKNNEEDYLFSIEKLVSNEDQERYKIVDVFKFTDYSSANNKVEIKNQKDRYSVLFFGKDKVLKKWDFILKNSAISKSWNGKYECNFLRIKEESADPRAYAMIYIDIKDNKAIFRLDSYNETFDKDLLILNNNPNKIILQEKDNSDSKFSIIRKNDDFILTSDLLDKTTGEITTYKLKKKK